MAKRTAAPSRRAVLVDACRTPFLKSNTDFADMTTYDLGRMAIKGLLDKTQIEKEKIDQVIMGTVAQNLATSNVARESALAAGIPRSTPAHTVTMACVSANAAIANAIELIQSGQADVVIAGGTESSSDVPIQFRKKFRKKLVETQKYKKAWDYLKFLRGLRPADLLPDVPSISEYSTGRTMGQDSDRMSAKYGVTREEQDEYAARSHTSAAKAAENGYFDDQIMPTRIPPKFANIEKDNGVRGDTTVEKLAKLRPAFVKPYGTHTAGNSSFLTDGAAVCLLMSEDVAKALGYKAKAAFRGYAFTAQDPGEELLLGPAYATPKAIKKTGVRFNSIDVFEFHEAFAGQLLANLNCLNSTEFGKSNLGRRSKVGEVPMEKLNLWGGSLSIGHPFGATGARLVATTADRLIKEDGTLGLTASCAAGAHGCAMILERLN